MSDAVRRRTFLAAGATGALSLTGCDRILSSIADLFGGGMPSHIEPPDSVDVDSLHHLVGRAGFGPHPGQLEDVRRIGKEAYVDQQLDPSSIDDAACSLRTGVIDTVGLPTSLLFEFPPDEVEVELRRYALLRAVYSKRQLFEAMVEFWSDHFNIAISKSLCRHLKTADDREVVRTHALGRFRDLLGASALSPAMLVYLDGRENKSTSSADKPNENYARELMELHTLGIFGGYSQADVMEAARCLSGFVVREKWAPGLVEFVPERHDNGEKTVLGQHIAAGGGRDDVERLLDIVSDHPSTARHIAKKLTKVFVADDPPASIVTRVTDVFVDSKGDIAKVMRAILLSEEFEASKGAKVKRPFRLIVSALRASGADTHAKGGLLEHQSRMGQPLFSYPTPDGYPIRSDAWFATMLWRWSFAVALAEGRIDGVRTNWDTLVDAIGDAHGEERLARYFYGRRATDEELAPIAAYTDQTKKKRDPKEERARRIGLLLAAPAFQRY